MNKSLNPEILAPAGSMESLTAAVRCGADAVYLKIDVQNFKITVRIGLQSKSMYDSAVKLINRVKPCNMLLDHKLQYRTWREVKEGTNSWADLTPYTWQDIYEKEGIING